MKIALRTMGFKIIVTLALVLSMIYVGYEAPHVGLALATSLSAVFQSWLLYHRLRKDDVYHPDPGWILFLVRILVACAAMSALLYYGVPGAETWSQWGVMDRALNAGLWVSAGGIVYFLVLILSGMKLKPLLKHQ